MKRIKYIVCEHIVAQVFDLLLFIILLLSYDGKMFVLRQKKTSTNYLQQSKTEVLKVHYVGIPWEEGTSLNAGN